MSLVIFTVTVLVAFVVTGGNEPSTLIVSVFGFCGFEFGIMGWIKTAKETASKEAMEKAKEEQNNAAKVTAETEQEIK